MNRKALLGISLTATFAVSMFMAQNALAGAPPGDFKEVTGFEVEPFKNKIDVTIHSASDTIPNSTSTGFAFGYGLVTGTNDDGYPENVLALTTHLCVSDTPVQGDAACGDATAGLLEALGFGEGQNELHDNEKWHAHILDLKPSTAECITAVNTASGVHNSTTYEVDFGRTLTTQNNLSPGWTVTDDSGSIKVEDVPRGDPHSAAYKKAIALYFGIVGIVDDSDMENPVVTNLCLTVPPP